jgi:hypothetical protein
MRIRNPADNSPYFSSTPICTLWCRLPNSPPPPPIHFFITSPFLKPSVPKPSIPLVMHVHTYRHSLLIFNTLPHLPLISWPQLWNKPYVSLSFFSLIILLTSIHLLSQILFLLLPLLFSSSLPFIHQLHPLLHRPHLQMPQNVKIFLAYTETKRNRL